MSEAVVVFAVAVLVIQNAIWKKERRDLYSLLRGKEPQKGIWNLKEENQEQNRQRRNNAHEKIKRKWRKWN